MRFYIIFFFFSSRRRHTRYWRDWSSDVCSSDLFVVLCLLLIIISHICAKMGVNINANLVDKVKGGTKLVNVNAVSLLTPDGIRYMFTSAVDNFTGFAPLGTVLVAMLGVGLAEETGLIQAILKKSVLKAPKKFVTMIIVLLGVMSNIASDAGYIVLIPLGAMEIG